jgi:hypothetical protein
MVFFLKWYVKKHGLFYPKYFNMQLIENKIVFALMLVIYREIATDLKSVLANSHCFRFSTHLF